MQNYLPKVLSNLHQRFLTQQKYNVFWEMNLLHMVLYGSLFNTIVFIFAVITQNFSNEMYWFLRIPSIIGLLFWLWSTFQSRLEIGVSQLSSFRLRARFLIYSLGILFLYLPLEFYNSSWLYKSFPMGFSIVFFGIFLLSILLHLVKIAYWEDVIKAIMISIPIIGIMCLVAILLGFLGSAVPLLAPFCMLLSYGPLIIPFSSKSLGYFLMNISFPFLFVQLSLMITMVYFVVGQSKMNFLQEMLIHLIPLAGYLVYVWFLPRLSRKVMVAEARP
jgi:hypothetical protein